MLRLVTDEDLNGDIVRGVRRRQPGLDLIRMQEVGLRTVNDETLLEWAAANGRIVISNDRNWLVGLAYQRVVAGLPMPGVFALRPEVTVGEAIDAIFLIANCSTPEEWKDRVVFLPL
jgi:hypothetical protein